jgi:hypothetical protein
MAGWAGGETVRKASDVSGGGPGPFDWVGDGSAGSGVVGSGGGKDIGKGAARPPGMPGSTACPIRKTAALTNGCPDPGFSPGLGTRPSRSGGR